MLCSTRKKVEHHFLVGLSTMASLHYLSPILHAKFYRCFTVVQNHQFGNFFLQKYWFFYQIEKVKGIDRKILTESINRDISVIFYLRNLLKKMIVGFFGISSKVCFVCWWNFRDACCVKPLLQARHLIYTKSKE